MNKFSLSELWMFNLLNNHKNNLISFREKKETFVAAFVKTRMLIFMWWQFSALQVISHSNIILIFLWFTNTIIRWVAHNLKSHHRLAYRLRNSRMDNIETQAGRACRSEANNMKKIFPYFFFFSFLLNYINVEFFLLCRLLQLDVYYPIHFHYM